jgi:cbb3-type cytochrome oxidase maturation protein
MEANMTIVLLLIPLGLVLVAVAAWALFWAVDSGQYDGDVEAQGLIAVEGDEPSSSSVVHSG